MAKLSPIESEFATTEEAEAYDVWFRAKVQEALQSTRPKVSHDDAMRQVRATIAEAKRAAGHLDG